MSWFPGYLVKERGFTIMSSGIYLIIPYLAAFAGMYVAGGLGDRGWRRSLISLVTAILTFPALVAMGMSESVTATITFMSIALFLNSAAVNGFVVLVFDLIPAQVFGTAIGIVGGLCGGLGGVLGPLLLGYLYDKTGTFFWGFVSARSRRSYWRVSAHPRTGVRTTAQTRQGNRAAICWQSGGCNSPALVTENNQKEDLIW